MKRKNEDQLLDNSLPKKPDYSTPQNSFVNYTQTAQGNVSGPYRLDSPLRPGISLEFSMAAWQGDPAAQLKMGHAFRYGYGVSPDLKEALKWFFRSASQGNAEAQHCLGNAYQHGEGVPLNLKKEALRWYMQAAAQGHADSQCRMGDAYLHGKGVRRDINAAICWYKKAAAQGHSNAQRSLDTFFQQSNLGNQYGLNQNSGFAPLLNKGLMPSQNPVFVSPQTNSSMPPQNPVFAIPQTNSSMPRQNPVFAIPQTNSSMPRQNSVFAIPQTNSSMPRQNPVFAIPQINSSMPPQNNGFAPPQNNGFTPPQNNGLTQQQNNGLTQQQKQLLQSQPFKQFQQLIQIQNNIDQQTNSSMPQQNNGFASQQNNGLTQQQKQLQQSQQSQQFQQFLQFQQYQQLIQIQNNIDQQNNILRKQAAEQGNALSQYLLGADYKMGHGVPQDLKQAAYWFHKAALQGNTKAENELGLAYTDGEGVTLDLEKGVYWYKRAAANGHCGAQNNLGYIYQHGKGVQKNLDEAIYYYRIAAMQGFLSAQYNLGHIYEHVTKDLQSAAYWYKKAADQGHASAKNNLDSLFQNDDTQSNDTQSDEVQNSLDDSFPFAVTAKNQFVTEEKNTADRHEKKTGKKNEVGSSYLHKTGIAPKYFGESRHVQLSGFNKGRTTVKKNKERLCAFKLLKDIEAGHSPSLLQQHYLTIEQNEFSYITNEPLVPSSDTRCIFIMAGRKDNASLPCHVADKARTILVITQDELASFFLTKKERVWLVDKEQHLTVDDKKNATVLVQMDGTIKQYNAQGACILTIKKQQQFIATVPQALTQSGKKIQINLNHDSIDFHQALDCKLQEHKGTSISGLLLPDRTDLLVIKQLTSNAYGAYEQPGLVNTRRIAALLFALHYQINDLMMMDDNIQELHSANGSINTLDGLWAYWENTHKPKHILSSVFTDTARNLTKHNEGLGSKLFLINANELKKVFPYIKSAELAFFLFMPPHLGAIPMEDYYFQLLVKHGVKLNSAHSIVHDHAFLDSDTVTLTRLQSNRNKAKGSLNSFGAFCWLDLSEAAINCALSVDALYTQNAGDKSISKLLVEKASTDLASIIKNNIITQHQHLINCRNSDPRTLGQFNSNGGDLLSMQVDSQSLWEQIKAAKDLNLRAPQIDAIDLWLAQKQARALAAYSIATGVGKTYIKAILAYLEAASTGKPVLVVTADRKLVEGLTKKFAEILEQLKSITGALTDLSVIPIMSGGPGSVSQKQLSDSKAFAYQQNIYVFCEESFQKFIQEQQTDLGHINMILFDEYHCYNNTLAAAISYVHGFTVYIGTFAATDKFAACYCIDLKQNTITLWDAKANKRMLDGKPTTVFSQNQLTAMNKLLQGQSYVPLRNDLLTADFQQYLITERERIPLLSVAEEEQQSPVPLFVGGQLPASAIQWGKGTAGRGTYFNRSGIHQTNQYGLTQLIVRPEDNEYNLEISGDEAYDEVPDGALCVIELPEETKHGVNELILKNNGIPCIEPADLNGSFILTNKPPQFIYKDHRGEEHELARGFDVYQAWGLDLLAVQDEIQPVALFFNDAEKMAALNKFIMAYQLNSFPMVKTTLQTNLIGFSATPPEKDLLCRMFTYNKEQAEQAGYIVPTIVRLMDIPCQKPLPYKELFKDILAMKGPNGDCLQKMKGIYRFKSINELKIAEQSLDNMGHGTLEVFSLYTQKGSSYSNEEQQKLERFSTISYNQGAVLLVVSKLQKGWDEPKLRYTVDFKNSAGIKSAIQFSGRASRVYEDKKENNGASNKIGLSFFVSSNSEVKKHLEPLKTPLPNNKCLSSFFSAKAQGNYIKEGNYNLRSTPVKGGRI